MRIRFAACAALALLAAAGCSTESTEAAAVAEPPAVASSAPAVSSVPSVAPIPPAASTPPRAPAVPAATGSMSDPRCTPAPEDIVTAVSLHLKDGLSLSNAVVIEDGGLTFFGATTLDADGGMENRSDVWVVQGMFPVTSSGGARSATPDLPKASTVLDISAGDERVQAVDNCVVQLTRN